LVPGAAAPRSSALDEFAPKLEELIERSKGKIRADVAHDRRDGVRGIGAHHPPRGRGDQEGVAGRAVPGAPAVDPGAGDVGGRMTSATAPGSARCDDLVLPVVGVVPIRVVLPLLDKSTPSVVAAIDAALRRVAPESSTEAPGSPPAAKPDPWAAPERQPGGRSRHSRASVPYPKPPGSLTSGVCVGAGMRQYRGVPTHVALCVASTSAATESPWRTCARS